MEKNEALEIYIHEIAINQQLSVKTIESYTNALKKYFLFLSENNINNIEEVKQSYIIDYVDEISKNFKTSTIKHNISVIRNFHSFIATAYDLKNPTLKIKIKKQQTFLPKLISEKDLKAIFDSFSESEEDIFLNAIFEVLYSCGLRVSELCDLKMTAISFENKIMTIVGKGSKKRIIPFSETALKKINKYLYYRNQYNKKNLSYLFINHLGNKLNRQYVYNSLQKILKACGIKNHYSPHSFRHTYASHLLEGGADLRYVQELLGHSDISTTQIYVHLQSKKIKKDYDKYFFRGKSK